MVENATIASIQSQLNINNYLGLASYNKILSAILYYDYGLTLPSEIDRFWSTRSLSWASSFFYINRYFTLFGYIPVMLEYYWASQNPDRAQYLAVVIQVIVGILLIMRTYALYDRNLRVLLYICACALAVIIFGTWSVAAGHDPNSTQISPEIGCIPPISMSDAFRLANAWIGMLMFDILIFGMTVYKSWRRGQGGDRSLLRVLLRDGAIYFGIMAIVNLMNILTFHLSPPYQRGFITTFANVISSTMISRLMLNLRDPKLARMRMPTDNTGSPYPVLSTVFEFNTVSNATEATTSEGSPYP